MNDLVERLKAAKDPNVMLLTHPPQFRTDALCAEAAEEIERLRDFNNSIWGKLIKELRECHELTKENLKLREALEGVIRVADRDCPEFRAARAALTQQEK
jgi:hypothetical protein